MPTDAERASEIVGIVRSPSRVLGEFMLTREGAEKCVAAALAAVRAESPAEIAHLRQRCAELEAKVAHLMMVEPHAGNLIEKFALRWAVAGRWADPHRLEAERHKLEEEALETFCACARPYLERCAELERERDGLAEDLRKERNDLRFLIENLTAAGITIEPAQGGIHIVNAAERERDETKRQLDSVWSRRGQMAQEPVPPPAAPDEVRRLRRIIEDMRSMEFGCSGKDARQVQDWFRRRADDALDALLAAPAQPTEDAERIARIERYREALSKLNRRLRELGEALSEARELVTKQAEAINQQHVYRDELLAEIEETKRERDEAAHQRDYYKGRDDEGAVIQKELEDRLTRARAQLLQFGETYDAADKACDEQIKALEARLARARADALEDAARVAEQEVTTYHEGMSAVDVRLSHTRGPKWSDGPSIANAIRALASDTDTGGGDAPYTDTEAATSEGE
jgi:hypothetical protein